MQQNTAVYPGSFDPITLGHVDIIERISQQFNKVIVLVADSNQKSSLFSVAEKVNLIKDSLPHLKNLEVTSHQGLTVDFLRRVGAKTIVRGLRAVVDFEYEMAMANMNKKLAPDIETMLVFAKPEFYFISSRGVKEVAKNKGNLTGLVPPIVIESLNRKYGG